jgi:TldD protein
MFDGEKVLKVLAGSGALYGDVFAEQKEYTHIHFESGRLEKVEKALDEGVGLRIVMPWKTFYASTTSLAGDGASDCAQALAAAAASGAKAQVLAAAAQTASYPFHLSVDPGTVEIGRKVALVKRVESMARRMERRIRQAKVVLRDSTQRVAIRTTDGTAVDDGRTQIVLNLLLVGEENGEMQTSYEAVGGFYGFEYFTEELVEGFVEKTVKRLSGLLGAMEAPSGPKAVVLAAEAGGTMIHEAVGHGLEADLAMEGLSCYQGMMGKQIASPLITVVDDATVPNLRGTYAFDDEGVAGERTVLVEHGILKEYLWDRFHAMRYGQKSTGNGRRESFRHKPIPRMSNTMILSGVESPERIVGSVDDGVYVVKMGGGQVDTVRGDFVFEISEGYLIEKGAVGPMIKNATMMGNGFRVLQTIDMVGSDLGLGIGTCGKDGQGVPVADGQPTLRIPEIIVGGRQ